MCAQRLRGGEVKRNVRADEREFRETPGFDVCRRAEPLDPARLPALLLAGLGEPGHLYLSLRLPLVRTVLEPLYYLGEYVFAGFVLAGCRNLATGARAGRRSQWLLLPAAALAVAHLPGSFSAHIVPQAAVVAALLALARREVRHVPPGGRGRVGVLLLEVSLAALAL